MKGEWHLLQAWCVHDAEDCGAWLLHDTHTQAGVPCLVVISVAQVVEGQPCQAESPLTCPPAAVCPRFMAAVYHLGVNKATGSDILSCDGMTRHHVDSHLQNYRLHLCKLAGVGPKDALPEDKVRKWGISVHGSLEAGCGC